MMSSQATIHIIFAVHPGFVRIIHVIIELIIYLLNAVFILIVIILVILKNVKGSINNVFYTGHLLPVLLLLSSRFNHPFCFLPICYLSYLTPAWPVLASFNPSTMLPIVL
jgi:hypothetical protein